MGSIRGRDVLDDYGKPAWTQRTPDGFDARIKQSYPPRLWGSGFPVIFILMCISAVVDPSIHWILYTSMAAIALFMAVTLMANPEVQITARGSRLVVSGYFQLVPWQQTKHHEGAPPSVRLYPGLEKGPPSRSLTLRFAGQNSWDLDWISVDRETGAELMACFHDWAAMVRAQQGADDPGS
jgi:hypothetical protein